MLILVITVFIPTSVLDPVDEQCELLPHATS